AQGDFAPLAEFALGSRRNLVNSVGQGLYLSVTCSEDLPFMSASDAERAAANTFLGDYRYKQQRAACDAWVRGPVPADRAAPVRADTPTLLFSGSWDPVTPASNAEKVASTLPHSLSIVVPAGGHGYGGIPGAGTCVSTITTQFVERGSTDGVDVSCVKNLHRPPFPTQPLQTRTINLSTDQLSAIAGRYVGEGAPGVEITADGGRLAGRVEGQEHRIMFAPVSPTRLRLLGDVGSYLNIEMHDGKAARITLEQSGVTTLTWTKAQ
ncbi:MAG TPA: alpha/beta hydrolase, partial [Gemmatimonadaceae bacterium]|nr:alpha/beta hydrolase [Gemmatimonadaceae bacterium]